MKESTKKMIVGGFFAFLMIASVFAFAVNFVTQSSLEYSGHKFKQVQNMFETEIEGTMRQFYFFPGDLEVIELPNGTAALFESPVIAMTYDPESGIVESLADAQYYFEQQLEGNFVIERALVNNTGTSLPEKDCKDATRAEPVIKIQEADNSSIMLENYCLIISVVNSRDLIEESERVIYSALGVMKSG